MKTIRIKNVTKRFGERTILNNVSLDLPGKGLFAIVGESGSGKSTLLELISGIDTNYDGEISVLGRSLSEYSENELAEMRLTKIGFIRQSYDLLNLENVYDNVALPLKGGNLSKSLIKRKVKEALYNCQLQNKDNQIVSTLSGGEKQRVALARALVNDPVFILADEPTGALDQQNAEKIYKLLLQISKTRLVLLVSHDLERSSKYCNGIIKLEDGKLHVENNQIVEEEDSYLSAEIKKEKKVKFPFAVWFKHGYHLLKAKKWRTLILSSILVFSLLSFGLSLYVSRDLGAEINSAFTSLTGENMLVMEKAGSQPSFGRVISASESQVQYISECYEDHLEGYGLSYLARFESFFPQSNRIYFSSKGRRATIEGGSIRSINDFLWLDSFYGKKFYPSIPLSLEQDQICLSLNYPRMVKMCSELQIERSFDSLGEYLKEEPLSLFLEVQNDDWSYWDLQSFNVVAITESDTFSIIHSDHKWNEYMLEEKMRFPSSDEEDTSLPWILNKVFYLETTSNPQDFFKAIREDKEFGHYLFERTNSTYDQTHNNLNEAGKLNRYYVYLSDSNYLEYKNINEISELECFASTEVYGEQSYSFYAGSLATGFTNPFFLSDDKEKIEMASDALSRVPKDLTTNEIELPQGVIQGSVFKPRNTALTFSNDFRKLIKGREPKNEKEICISSALERKISSKTLFCSGMVNSYIDGDYQVREYRIGELEVVGVVDNELDVLYGETYWCIDYWRDVFGMSCFYLPVNKVSFSLKENYDSQDIINKLSARYPNYHFVDPSKAVKDSVSSVVGFIEVSLKAASAITLVTCLFLLLTVSLLTGLENKGEARLMFTLGIKRGEITDSVNANLLLMLVYGMIFSSTYLLFMEVMVDKLIKGLFQSNQAFVFDLIPMLSIFFVGFIGLFCSCLFMIQWVKRRNFLREG